MAVELVQPVSVELEVARVFVDVYTYIMMVMLVLYVKAGN